MTDEQKFTPPAGIRVKPLEWEDAVTLAQEAIWADGRGMIGRNRNHLVERVARAIVHHEKRILSALETAPQNTQPDPEAPANAATQVAGGEVEAWTFGFIDNNTGQPRRGLSFTKPTASEGFDPRPLYTHPAPSPAALGAGVKDLRDAASALLDGMQSTYRARNNRQVGIEADDGEKCWIVHSDLTYALESALAALTLEPDADTGRADAPAAAFEAVRKAFLRGAEWLRQYGDDPLISKAAYDHADAATSVATAEDVHGANTGADELVERLRVFEDEVHDADSWTETLPLLQEARAKITALQAEIATYRREIMRGEPDPSFGLGMRGYIEMIRSLHAAVDGGRGRAEAAEAERDRLRAEIAAKDARIAELERRGREAATYVETIIRAADSANKKELERKDARIAEIEALINHPHNDDWFEGTRIEAAHQVERWGAAHDAGKAPLDWFWLVGFLAQKAATAAIDGAVDKARHHTISTAAALLNWHRHLSRTSTLMRPGIDPAARGIEQFTICEACGNSTPLHDQAIWTDDGSSFCHACWLRARRGSSDDRG